MGARLRKHDFDTLEDNAVTIRERDSMKQERISIDQVESYLAGRLLGCGAGPSGVSSPAPLTPVTVGS